jgi:fatty-acyl-CoA synthase
MDASSSTHLMSSRSAGADVWLPGWAPQPGRIARARFSSPADMAAIEKYPASSLLPGRTIYECIKSARDLDPARAAMIFLASAQVSDAPRVISYADLVAAIERSANLFWACADSARSAVAVILPMVPEGLITTWGAATAGICVPINPHLEANAVLAIMNAAKVTVLVTTVAQFSGVWGGLPEAIAKVPTLRRILYLDSLDPVNHLATVLQTQPAGKLTFEATSDSAAEAMYMPTGGTTAAPKLVRMTHGGQLTIAWNVGALMGSTPDGVVGHGMPNFHCGGAIALGLRTVIYGQTLLTLTADGFRNQGVIRHFWDIAGRYRMTSVLSTPTTAAAILAVPDTTLDGHCITDFHCGGSIVPMELMRAFHGRFGIWLRENWGMTEVHGTTTGHPNNGQQPRVGSVGCSLPYYRTKAIKVNEANAFESECAPGERGVLVIGGPSLTPGYADSLLDGQFFVTGMPDGKLWANTGDLGAVDEDGFVWVFGRTKDLIIRGGHNIDPGPIEEVLLQHPAVYMAAAIGRPDAHKGELPVAYVQLKAGEQVTAAELIDFCRGRIQERAAVPVDIIMVDAIPLTAVGKISKVALRTDAMQRVVSSVASGVMGADEVFKVTIDLRGLRPTAVLEVEVVSGNSAAIKAKLGQALAGFEFETRVVTHSLS